LLTAVLVTCSLIPPQVFTVEMHHKRVEKAGPGDNVGMNIKGLDKGNMPRTGDVMILKSDGTLKPVSDFTAQVRPGS
jgi:elongation factor 1-alpha